LGIKLIVRVREALDEVRNLPTLRKWSSRSGNPKTYFSKDDYAADGKSKAITELNLIDHKSSEITYYATSFTSYRTLAQTILHELGHARFNYLGCIDGQLVKNTVIKQDGLYQNFMHINLLV
jgi:hypothetical protein